MKNNKIANGIIILVFGIVLVIGSQTFSFDQTVKDGDTPWGSMSHTEENAPHKNGILLGGIVCLFVGGIVLAVAFNKKNN